MCEQIFNFIFCNQAFANHIGFADHINIPGKTDYDFFSSVEAKKIWLNDLTFINSASLTIVDEDEYMTIKMPIRNDENIVLGLLNISVNIKSQIDKKLKTLDTVIAEMPRNIYWKDKNGTLLGCNSQQATELGLKSRQDIIGKTNYDLLSKIVDENKRIGPQVRIRVKKGHKDLFFDVLAKRSSVH